MKIAVIQCSDGKQNELNQLSIKINKLYCNINNYDYFYNEYLNIQSLGEICFKKFEYIKKYIQQYDYIVYIDMDAVFANPNIKLNTLIDNQHELFICQDTAVLINILNLKISYKTINQNQKKLNLFKFYQFNNQIIKSKKFNIISNLRSFSNNPFGINAGFYIMHNSSIILNFINDCLKYKQLFLMSSYDQDCIGRLLQLQKYSNIYKLLDYKVQGNGNPNNNSFFKYNEDINFICHCSGVSYQMKIQYLKNILNNKWWKILKEIK